MPNARIDCFLDTDVLVYAAQTRARDERRTRLARELALSRVFGVSAQTLSEFFVVTTRRAHVRLPPDETDRWIAFLSSFPLQPVDRRVVVRGIDLSRRHRLQYFDATLIAAAERLGAPIFYSEDLNHGQLYGDVRVINPFLEH